MVTHRKAGVQGVIWVQRHRVERTWAGGAVAQHRGHHWAACCRLPWWLPGHHTGSVHDLGLRSLRGVLQTQRGLHQDRPGITQHWGRMRTRPPDGSQELGTRVVPRSRALLTSRQKALPAPCSQLGEPHVEPLSCRTVGEYICFVLTTERVGMCYSSSRKPVHSSAVKSMESLR